MARMLTPMMLLARVTTELYILPTDQSLPLANQSTKLYFMSGEHRLCIQFRRQLYISRLLSLTGIKEPHHVCDI
jgi:hypothetical protein